MSGLTQMWTKSPVGLIVIICTSRDEIDDTPIEDDCSLKEGAVGELKEAVSSAVSVDAVWIGE